MRRAVAAVRGISADAVAAGSFTLSARADGARQWAFDVRDDGINGRWHVTRAAQGTH